MRIRALLWGLGALSLIAAGTGHAHEADDPGGPTRPPQVLAPGYGELEFAAPVPGSYALPPLGEAADGEVLRSDGSATTLHALLGDKLVLLSFIYASCNDVNGCPLATAVLHRVQRRLQDEPGLVDQLRLVSLSFDPTRDTPAVMGKYGEGFAGAGLEWLFLTTASEARLKPILEGYGQSLRKESDAEGQQLGTISHILRVFLIDRARRIRNIYSVSFLHPDTLISDVKTLLMEAEGSAPVAAEGAAPAQAQPGLPGPGDSRVGYERSDYRTRSRGLAARRGEPADLVARSRAAPLGLPPVPVPGDNPMTAEKVALGRKLFYDRRLSGNGTLSCAMCHIPEQGFTSNELAIAVGVEGRSGRRNAPTLYNVAYLPRLMHDGRETRLEHQVWGPLLDRNEMGNPSIGAVLERIRSTPDYDGLFEAAFPGRGLTMETIGMSIASYERSLVSGGSPFDRWYYGKDEAALGDDAKRGFRIFTGKAGCSACHTVGSEHALFTDGDLHNTGVGYASSMLEEPAKRHILVAPGRYLTVDRELVARVSEPAPRDLGLYEITQSPADRWKYRTPTLRNVALTAPYMHDGSQRTLRDVVYFYDRGGVPHEVLDSRIRPLELSPAETDALLVFLESLTGDDVAVLVADAFAAPVGDVRQQELAAAPGQRSNP